MEIPQSFKGNKSYYWWKDAGNLHKIHRAMQSNNGWRSHDEKEKVVENELYSWSHTKIS